MKPMEPKKSMNPMQQWRGWLLRLYPPAWRARYAEEFLALLDACPLSIWTLWDVCLGALDARLHLAPVSEGMRPLIPRFRTSAVTVFCAYIGFVVAGLAFGQMVEYDDFQHLLASTSSVTISYWVLYAGAFIALVAVLVGGVPLAVAAGRFALATKRWRLLLLFAVPPVSLMVWLGYVVLVQTLNPNNQKLLAASLAERIVIMGVFLGLFGLAAIASTAAVSLLILHSQISEKLFRFVRVPALITTLAMGVMFLAVVAYGLAARAANPQLFAENNGLLGTNTTLCWLVLLAMMACATVIAVVALIRSTRGNRSGTHATTPTAQAMA
jgi:hypothetical protein